VILQFPLPHYAVPPCDCPLPAFSDYFPRLFSLKESPLLPFFLLHWAWMRSCFVSLLNFLIPPLYFDFFVPPLFPFPPPPLESLPFPRSWNTTNDTSYFSAFFSLRLPALGFFFSQPPFFFRSVSPLSPCFRTFSSFRTCSG